MTNTFHPRRRATAVALAPLSILLAALFFVSAGQSGVVAADAAVWTLASLAFLVAIAALLTRTWRPQATSNPSGLL